MNSINHKLVIRANAEKVFEAVTTEAGLKQWFAKETQAKPEIGFINTFKFGTFVNELKVTALTANTTVEWTCTKSVDEWVGTNITFALEETPERTILRFTHAGWKALTDAFASTNYDWGRFLASLKSYCENGKGLPS
jgi:uncharacterized protein YndB with AHSA1/START domain